MQAGHDLLHFNFISQLQEFDHLEFSGVVPRTFVGSIIVTLVSLPLHLVNGMVMPLFCASPPATSAVIYRASLGIIVWLAVCSFRYSVKASMKFSPRTSTFFALLLAAQFHIPYYASRSLPNTFALALIMIAYSFWFQNKPTICLYIVGIATVLFRCDMLVLLAPMTLQMLVFEQLPFGQTFAIGVCVCVVTLLVSIPIDSYFWKRLLWPEGEVLFFNTVENRSGEWGEFPWHWYFSTALPKALHTNIPLVALGILNPYRNARQERATVWYYLFPTLCFLCLYSFLPHKELRFVFPAVPMFTLAAARGLDSILPQSWFTREESSSSKATASASLPVSKSSNSSSLSRLVACIGLLGFVLVTVSVTSVFSLASQFNYPGGDALLKLNDRLFLSKGSQILTCSPAEEEEASRGKVEAECINLEGWEGGQLEMPIIRVHIDAAAAMSGINR